MLDEQALRDALARNQGDLKAALCELTGHGPHQLARAAGVAPRTLHGCLEREAPHLHVRRALEDALGLPPYTLDPYLEA